jgi:hypothetical protein
MSQKNDRKGRVIPETLPVPEALEEDVLRQIKEPKIIFPWMIGSIELADTDQLREEFNRWAKTRRGSRVIPMREEHFGRWKRIIGQRRAGVSAAPRWK